MPSSGWLAKKWLWEPQSTPAIGSELRDASKKRWRDMAGQGAD